MFHQLYQSYWRYFRYGSIFRRLPFPNPNLEYETFGISNLRNIAVTSERTMLMQPLEFAKVAKHTNPNAFCQITIFVASVELFLF